VRFPANILKFSRYFPALILCAGLLPSAWLLYRFPDTPQLGMAGDDVMYIGAARSLADGQGYREAALPGNPWQTKFPPGYPVMLAAILKANPAARDFWIIAHSWLWLVTASVALAWAMAQAGLSAVQGAVVAALWAANPAACYVGTAALSEAPYCALLFFAVGCALNIDRPPIQMAVLAGVLVGVATTVRISGLVACAAIFAWFLWSKRVRAAAWFFGSAVVLPAIWMVWARAHLPLSHDVVTTYYLDYGGRWLQTVRAVGLGTLIIKNLPYCLTVLGGFVIASKTLMLLRAIRDLLLIAFVAGALTEWAGGPFAVIALVTAAFHLGWNWPPNERFLLAASPALLGALVVKLGSRPAILRIAALAIVAVADVYGTASLSDSYIGQRGQLAALAPAYSFIEAEVPRDATILGDTQLWLHLRRRAIGMPRPMEYSYSGHGESAIDGFYLHYRAIAKQFGASYMLVAPWDLSGSVSVGQERFFAAVDSDPGLLRVFSSNGVELFRVR
jgi:hypothetical protein